MARNEEMIGLAEAAKALRIAYQDAHRLLMLGKLEGMKRGGRWLVRAADVARLVAERDNPSSEACEQP